MPGSATIQRNCSSAQLRQDAIGRVEVRLGDRQPQPLVRQPPGEPRHSAGPEESDDDAVAQEQQVASPQEQGQFQPVRGGKAEHRHHAEHRQARDEHENHEQGQAGQGQTEEGRALSEREEPGGEALT